MYWEAPPSRPEMDAAPSGLGGEGLVGGVGVRVDRGDVQVTDAGGQAERGRQGTEDVFDGFHMLSWIRS